MKILVTGASGFVGSHLASKLSKNPELKILGTYFKHPLNLHKAELYRLNITDFSEVLQFLEEHSPEVVIHTAARVSFRKKDKEQLFRINVEGTRNLVNAMLETNIPRIIYVSSVAALAKKTDKLITEEDLFEKTQTSSTYGQTKFLGELEIWRGQEEGLRVTVLNPSLILGPSLSNWKHSSTTLFPRTYQGLPFVPPGSMGFVSVHDLVGIIEKALFSQKTFGKKWIVSAENRTWASVFRKIAESLGKKPPTRIFPRKMIALYARLATFLPEKFLPLTREEALASASEFRYDNTKILEEFSWTFKPIDKEIKETAKAYLEYLQKQGET